MNKWVSIALAILLLVAVFVFAEFVDRSPTTIDPIDNPDTSNLQLRPEQEEGIGVPNPIESKRVEDSSAAISTTMEAPGDNTPIITRELRIEERAVDVPMIDPDSIREPGTTSASRSGSTATALPGSVEPQLTMQGPGTGQARADTQFTEMDLTPIESGVIDDGPGDPIRMSPAPGPGEGFQDVPGLGPGEGYQGVPGPGPGENDFAVPGPGPGEVEPVAPEPAPEENGDAGS